MFPLLAGCVTSVQHRHQLRPHQFLGLIFVCWFLSQGLQTFSCERHRAHQHCMRQGSSSDWAFNYSPCCSRVTHSNIPDLWPCKPPQLFQDSLEDLCFVWRKVCHRFSHHLLHWLQGTGSADGDPCKQTKAKDCCSPKCWGTEGWLQLCLQSLDATEFN